MRASMGPMTSSFGIPAQMPGSGQMRAPTGSPMVGVPAARQVAQVNSERCTGCGRCMTVCPAQAIFFDSAGKATVNTALCRSCGVCADQCPVQAISFVAPALAK